ncbi:uncharacterized protein LOC131242016 [Magnolia sinica]|uniref:uncharacterized protein LOC131242016 n=1 Tax=Magnolia sinica TaxID=86752 RepID=UPI00265A4A6F|nr:uncharacterized protein LOC131242016 [Magnolia sinica]
MGSRVQDAEVTRSSVIRAESHPDFVSNNMAAKTPEIADPEIATLFKAGRAALLSAGDSAGEPGNGGVEIEGVGEPVGEDEEGEGDDGGGPGGETVVDGDGEDAGGLEIGEGEDAGGVTEAGGGDAGARDGRRGETVGAADGEDPGACASADPASNPSIIRIATKLL